MKQVISGLLIFVAGAAVGSLVTYKIVNTKATAQANERADEEIHSVREFYMSRVEALETSARTSDEEEPEEEQKTVLDIPQKPNIKELYKSVVANTNYSNLFIQEQAEKEEETKMINNPIEESEPYIISPDDFAQSEYETVTWTYYADGYLTDEWDELVSESEVEQQISRDSLSHFGEYENAIDKDSIYVRNDDLQTDYEILRDNSNYYHERDEE